MVLEKRLVPETRRRPVADALPTTGASGWRTSLVVTPQGGPLACRVSASKERTGFCTGAPYLRASVCGYVGTTTTGSTRCLTSTGTHNGKYSLDSLLRFGCHYICQTLATNSSQVEVVDKCVGLGQDPWTAPQTSCLSAMVSGVKLRPPSLPDAPS